MYYVRAFSSVNCRHVYVIGDVRDGQIRAKKKRRKKKRKKGSIAWRRRIGRPMDAKKKKAGFNP